jgi:hypothetical protein
MHAPTYAEVIRLDFFLVPKLYTWMDKFNGFASVVVGTIQAWTRKPLVQECNWIPNS